MLIKRELGARSEGILDVLELPHGQVHREVEPQVADAAQDAQGAFEAGLRHVAPGLVVGVYQRPGLAQQVEPRHQALLVQSHAHQSFELGVRPSLVASVFLQHGVDGPQQRLLRRDGHGAGAHVQAEGLRELAGRRLHEGFAVLGVVVLHEELPWVHAV